MNTKKYYDEEFFLDLYVDFLKNQNQNIQKKYPLEYDPPDAKIIINGNVKCVEIRRIGIGNEAVCTKHDMAGNPTNHYKGMNLKNLYQDEGVHSYNGRSEKVENHLRRMINNAIVKKTTNYDSGADIFLIGDCSGSLQMLSGKTISYNYSVDAEVFQNSPFERIVIVSENNRPNVENVFEWIR